MSNMLILIILFLIWLVVALFSRLSLLRIQADWLGKRTVITQFGAPRNLTPAEYGYIFDRKFGRNEMEATLIDLFQRKILDLRAVKTFASKDIVIRVNPKRPKSHKLDDCEAVLVAHVAYSQGGERRWSQMSSLYSRETGTRWQYERAVVNQLIDKGYVTESARNEPFIDRFLKSMLSFAVVWFVFFTTIGNGIPGASAFDQVDSLVSALFLVPLFLVAWLLMYIYLSILSHEIRLSAGLPRFATQKLRDEWVDVVGFRDYLRIVEWNRLKHQSEISNAALPYCLAAGLKVNVFKMLQ